MILIAPFAKKLREEKIHPKNYPYWNYVIEKIKEEIIQVGVEGELQLVSDFRKNLSMSELKSLILECKTWISVDSFFQHYCWELKKSGIVLFGPSDPNIFGHPENINLLKDRKYLREKQHWLWEQCDFDENAFVKSNEVINALKKFNVNVND
jgi:ADP-heptose:LPS heptosyltransferase